MKVWLLYASNFNLEYTTGVSFEWTACLKGIVGIRIGGAELEPPSVPSTPNIFHASLPLTMLHYAVGIYSTGSNYMLKVVVLRFPDQTPVLGEVYTCTELGLHGQ